MVQEVGGSARTSIEDAFRRFAAARQRLAGGAPETAQGAAVAGASFDSRLMDGIRAVDGEVKRADALVVEALEGRLDFHEVAVQIQSSQLTASFAMAVRNKLIDAYREVMRMSV